MKIFTRDILEESLADDFHSTLGWTRLDNGTLLATALASAIMVDLRQSQNENGVEIISALDADTIDELGTALSSAIDWEDGSFVLPLGTEVRSYTAGSVQIGDELWVTEAGETGLFPVEMARYHAYGTNLTLLREMISKFVQGSPWQSIGLPSAHLISDGRRVNLLAFPPCQEAGGVVLQRYANDSGSVCLAASTSNDIKMLALSIAADMKLMWHRRQDIAKQASEVRCIAEAKIPEDAIGVGVRAIAIDLHYQQFDEYLDFYVEYDAVDDAFRPGVVRDFIPAPSEGIHLPGGTPHGVNGRREDRAALRELDADGEIDSLAAAVVRSAPEGQMEVLSRLAVDYETIVQFVTPFGPIYATLFWCEGCIEVEISAPGRILKRGKFLEWSEGVFDAANAQALVGLTLTEVLSLPFDAKCTITHAVPLNRGVKVQFDTNRLLVNCAARRIWRR